MKKKITALLLTALLVFTFALPAFAASARKSAPDAGAVVAAVQSGLNADARSMKPLARMSTNLLRSVTERLKNVRIVADDIDAAVDECSRPVAGVYAAIGSSASELLAAAKDDNTPAAAPAARAKAAPAKASDGSMTFASLGELMGRYIFVKIDNADQVADLIAESCEFNYTVIDGGHGTVFIRVDIEKNPEIFNYAVFRRLVEDLYAKQGEEMLRNGDGSVDYLMSYEHIAGELALHAIIYAASSELLRLGVNNGTLLSLYRSAAQADLNVNEARLPGQVISAFGKLLINTVNYNLFKAVGII